MWSRPCDSDSTNKDSLVAVFIRVKTTWTKGKWGASNKHHLQYLEKESRILNALQFQSQAFLALQQSCWVGHRHILEGSLAVQLLACKCPRRPCMSPKHLTARNSTANCHHLSCFKVPTTLMFLLRLVANYCRS